MYPYNHQRSWRPSSPFSCASAKEVYTNSWRRRVSTLKINTPTSHAPSTHADAGNLFLSQFLRERKGAATHAPMQSSAHTAPTLHALRVRSAIICTDLLSFALLEEGTLRREYSSPYSSTSTSTYGASSLRSASTSRFHLHWTTLLQCIAPHKHPQLSSTY